MRGCDDDAEGGGGFGESDGGGGFGESDCGGGFGESDGGGGFGKNDGGAVGSGGGENSRLGGGDVAAVGGGVGGDAGVAVADAAEPDSLMPRPTPPPQAMRRTTTTTAQITSVGFRDGGFVRMGLLSEIMKPPVVLIFEGAAGPYRLVRYRLIWYRAPSWRIGQRPT